MVPHSDHVASMRHGMHRLALVNHMNQSRYQSTVYRRRLTSHIMWSWTRSVAGIAGITIYLIPSTSLVPADLDGPQGESGWGTQYNVHNAIYVEDIEKVQHLLRQIILFSGSCASAVTTQSVKLMASNNVKSRGVPLSTHYLHRFNISCT